MSEEGEEYEDAGYQQPRRSNRQTGSNKKFNDVFKKMREKRMKMNGLDDDADADGYASKKGKKSHAYEDDEDEGLGDDNDIYDVVDEDEYRSIVKKRREQGDFIVDDDGAGYVDDGEEHYWDKNGDSDNDSLARKDSSKNKKQKGKKTKSISTLSSKTIERKKKHAKGAGSSSDNNVEITSDADDIDLDNIDSSDVNNNKRPSEVEDEKKKPKANIKSLFAQMSASKSLESGASAAASLSTSGAKSGRHVNEEALIEKDDQLDGMLSDLLAKPNAPSINQRPISLAPAVPAHKTYSRVNRIGSTTVRRRQMHGNSSYGNANSSNHEPQINDEDGIDQMISNQQSGQGSGFSKKVASKGDDQDYDLGYDQPVHYRDDDNHDNNPSSSSQIKSASETAEVKHVTKTSTYTDEQIVIPASAIIRPGEIEEIGDDNNNNASSLDAKKKLFQTMKSKPIHHGQDGSASSGNDAQDGSSGNNNGEMKVHYDADTKDSYIDVYWMDMYEDKHNAPGSVFIFGKVRTNGDASNNVTLLESAADGSHTNSCSQFASVMIEVKNIQRTMYILPRDKNLGNGEDVTDDELKTEVMEMVRNIRSPNATGAVMRAKFVDMNYAFEMQGVPREIRRYLMVQYPMANEARGKFIPLDISGDTFSHVFGSNQSATERLVLSLHLMGPSWIRIRNPVITSVDGNESGQLSWCKNECLVDDPLKQISKIEDNTIPPTLRVLSLSMKTTVNRANHQHEIVGVSCFIQEDVALDGASAAHQSTSRSSSFTVIRAPGTSNVAQQALASQAFKNAYMSDPELKNKVFVQANERALLNFLCAQLHRKDPDIIVGHNITGFELDVLLTRMQALKVPQWSKIGRLKRSVMPHHSRSSSGRETHYGVLTPGRLVLDTYQTARELLLGQSDYTLSSLCESQKITMYRPDPKSEPIPYRRDDIDPSRVPRYFEENKIVDLIKHNLDTAKYTLQLAFRLEALPLTLELTTLGGNLWRRTLEGGRSERIEYLLLHSFQNKAYVVPDKYDPNLTCESLEASGKASFSQRGSSKSSGGKQSKTGNGNKGASNSQASAKKRKVGRQKPAYSGGLVLDPEPGLYDNYILLLDFNSLYPSIIQEFNICFTTIERPSGLGPGNSRSAKSLTASSSSNDEDGNENDMESQDQSQKDLEPDSQDADATGLDNVRHDGEEEEEGNAGAQGEIEQGVAPANETEAEMLMKIEPPPDDIRFGKEAVLPAVIRFLVERRRAVKAELKKEQNPARKKQLDVRQKALKITANSMYGCLGFTASRFYAKPLASLVTRMGREILQRTVKITNDLGFKVVYGDTDSIMVNTNEKENVAKVKEIASQIISSVNKQYRKLELDMDGMMQTLLLCKKKKYAALMVVGEEVDPVTGVKKVKTEKETKGLDLVRRDWCPLSRKIGHLVLDQILSGKDRDEVLNAIRKLLETLANDIRNGAVPLSDFQVTKGLNKSPNDYPDIKGQPHLQVAMAMMKAGKIVNTGDHIPYVICKTSREDYEASSKQQPPSPEAISTTDVSDSDAKVDANGNTTTASSSGSSNSKQQPQNKAKKTQASFAERAYHPNEVRESKGKLEIDHEWYLATQIMPPIQRLCDPIDGISHAELAGLLGLDASKYRQQTGTGSNSSQARDQLSLEDDDDIRFKDCDKVSIGCDACGYKYNFPGVYWMPEAKQKAKENGKENDPTDPYSTKKQRRDNGSSSFIESITATSGLHCPCCTSEFEPTYLQNILQNQIRHAIEKYQQGWAIPDDLTKEFKTRQRSVKEAMIQHEGRRIPLQLEYTSAALSDQITYIFSLVDVSRAEKLLKKENEIRLSLKKQQIRIQPLTSSQEKAMKSILNHLRRLYKPVSEYKNIEPSRIFSVFE